MPKTLDELHDIAQFFQGREIDGKKVYGASIYTERGSEGITMGVSNYLYDYGFKYQDPKKPYAMDGFVNSPGAVKGLEAYKDLYKCCTPPGASNSYMSEGLDAFKSGQVALQMNFFAFFPGLYKDPNVGGDKIGFFINPAGPAGQATQLGGQGISVVSYSKNQGEALQYIKWFAQRMCRRSGGRWAAIPAPSRWFERRASRPARRSRRSSCKSMGMVVDFWAEPSMHSCCKPSRSACMTTWSPTRAPRRKRSTGW